MVIWWLSALCPCVQVHKALTIVTSFRLELLISCSELYTKMHRSVHEKRAVHVCLTLVQALTGLWCCILETIYKYLYIDPLHEYNHFLLHLLLTWAKSLRLGLVFGLSRPLGLLRVSNTTLLNTMTCILVLACRNAASVAGVSSDVLIFSISLSSFTLVRPLFANDSACIGTLRSK